MSHINYPAVRAFLRAAAPMWAQQDQDRHLDHVVCPDGYGAAGLAVLHNLEERRLASRIGARFGLTTQTLINMVWEASHIQDDRTMEAISNRRYATAPGGMDYIPADACVCGEPHHPPDSRRQV